MTPAISRRTLLQILGAGGISTLGSCGQQASVESQTPVTAVQNASDADTPLKITDIRAFQPATPGSPPDWRTKLGQIIVEVHTESGLVGIGVGGGGAAGIHVIHTVLKDLLVGRDAAPVEELHRAMCEHTMFYGRKGLVIMALSGVDLALWDLRGKHAGQPVAKLLNPDVDLAAAIPTYATVFGDQEVAAAVAGNHAGLKLHVERFGHEPNVAKLGEMVKSVREQLGPKKSLMVDAYGKWNLETTARAAEAMAPHNLTFLEEPLPPDDLDGYEELVKRTRVPIAGGEHEYLAGGFKELIDRRLHAVLQPDINWCGGLTTVVEIYKLAKATGLTVLLHRGCEPFALHALAALDPKPLAESPRVWFKALRGAPEIEQGTIRLTDAPGFGVSVSA
jgi:L-alanine-DL-glutamate epimerase-like enolase superfamily enzyme